jgi:hypothetical protein
MAGGPYSLIQVYAWANMLVSYSQDSGILQATKDTFSGEKPCHLCEKIASNKTSEPDNSEPVLPVSHISLKALQEMLPANNIFLAAPRGKEWQPPAFGTFHTADGINAAAPPLPPPRV